MASENEVLLKEQIEELQIKMFEMVQWVERVNDENGSKIHTERMYSNYQCFNVPFYVSPDTTCISVVANINGYYKPISYEVMLSGTQVTVQLESTYSEVIVHITDTSIKGYFPPPDMNLNHDNLDQHLPAPQIADYNMTEVHMVENPLYAEAEIKEKMVDGKFYSTTPNTIDSEMDEIIDRLNSLEAERYEEWSEANQPVVLKATAEGDTVTFKQINQFTKPSFAERFENAQTIEG